MSDEAFARMHVTSRNHEEVDNRKMLFDLVNMYYPGRMRVVVVYRRYYEWLLSGWNSRGKPFVNGNGNTSNYKRNYKIGLPREVSVAKHFNLILVNS